jgi:hypothetical protein
MPLAIIQVQAGMRYECDECLDKLWCLHVFAGALLFALPFVLAALWTSAVLYYVLAAGSFFWFAVTWMYLCQMRRLCSFEEQQDRLSRLAIRHPSS